MRRFNPDAALNAQGIAAGYSNIKTDTIDFFYEEEKFSIPTIRAMEVAKWNGYFYAAKIDDVRKLACG